MAVEFIGSLVTGSLAGPIATSAMPPDLRRDPDYPVRVAVLEEDAGFDKLLVGYCPAAPDGLVVANEVLTATARLGVLLAHQPGLVAPTVAARQYSTLAAFHPGRVSMHVVSASGAARARDGDTGEDAAHARRTAEFLQVVRLAWASSGPFDYVGEFYRVAGAHSAVRLPGGRLPVYLDEAPDAVVDVSAVPADVYSLRGEALAVTAERIARVRAAAASRRRPLRFSVSTRIVAAPTEQLAWRRAGQLLGQARRSSPSPGRPSPSRPLPAGVLVGSYEQVADALLEYAGVGASTLVLEHQAEAEVADCAAVIALVRQKADGQDCQVA
jgi:alkanesulfonate monooxygenase